jgi:hypothetical protein
MGNEGINFYGKRGVNAADPQNDKDVVNLRSLRRYVETVTGQTSVFISSVGVGFPVYRNQVGNTFYFRSLSAGTNLNMVCGDTITYHLNNNIVVNGITANTITAGTIDAALYLSAGQPFNFTEVLWCAYTGSFQSIIRNNFTNNYTPGRYSIVGGAFSSAFTDFNGISSGSGNTVRKDFGYVGGGQDNTVSGLTALIAGGF